MKTLTKLTLLAAGLAAAAVAIPVLNAADDTAATAPAANHPLLRALMRRQAIRQHVAQKLGLTADQITQLKATRASTVAAVKDIRADTSLTADQKKAKVRETVQAAFATARGTLTADQQAQLREMRTQLRARIEALRGL